MLYERVVVFIKTHVFSIWKVIIVIIKCIYILEIIFYYTHYLVDRMYTVIE